MKLAHALGQAIGAATGEPFSVEQTEPAAGGCINRALVAQGGGRRYFVKINQARRLDMFQAEADGLAALGASGAIRVPAVVCAGASGNDSFLVLEHLDLRGRADFARLGEQLAALHRVTAPRFGWHRDNYIGSTPQRNPQEDAWPSFFGRCRIFFQLELARTQGHGTLYDAGLRLCDCIDDFFAGYRPAPSLLHGDLWSGNAAFLADGQPVVFDPAAYFGDREADLAMTELFGGFPPEFYAAYASAWPLDPGYRVRRDLYNLYHVLNHLHLFGGGYLTQAESHISSLLGAIGRY
jgi:fructosamine-3-kinase